eukprot:GFKZ01012653.1.p2 GENE.GFKZ01012653.1~~GFKZ01012653.1.p2  ORF type:complete len:175 (-),score=26.62 GFKZ01012653.1:203-727(-)
MTDSHKMIIRGGALFANLMLRQASRPGRLPIRMGVAGGASAVAAAGENASVESECDDAVGEGAAEPEAGGVGRAARSIGEQVSFGGVLGFAAGYSIRKVGKVLLFLVGTEVVILQYMAHREWLTMDWGKVGRDLAPRLDRGAVEGLVGILMHNMPFGAAFSGGLVAGLRLSSPK